MIICRSFDPFNQKLYPMNIAYLFKYLWKKKWLILLPAVIAIIAAWFFSRNQPLTYTSVAELSTGYMEVNPMDTRNGNNTVLFNNVIQTLQSNQILDQVSYSLLLHDLQGSAPFKKISNSAMIKNFPGGKEGLITVLHQKADSMSVLDLANDKDRMIRELENQYSYSPNDIIYSTQIYRIEGSDFINLNTVTTEPRLSAFIANGICRTFLAYYQNRQGQASAASLDTLKKVMDAKKQLLDNKLKLFQAGSDPSAPNSLGTLSNLQGLQTQQQSNLIAAQVELANVNKQISSTAKQGGLAANEEIISLRNNMDNLWSRYVNDGSKDADLLNQINKLRNDLQQKLSAIGTSSTGGVSPSDLVQKKMDLEVKINVAKQTIQDLQQKINSLNGVMQSSASREGDMQSLQSDIAVAQQDYANASKVYNDALNMNIFPGNNFKQTLLASPPLGPDPSKKMKTIGLAGAGVFALMTFLLIFFEFIDPSIKTPSHLKENIPFPLLANLERINMQETPVERIFGTGEPVSLAAKGFREQVKQLRYEVEASGLKTFLVVSYYAATGRTTLVNALGKSLSLNNRKVLMVDVNFQHNTLSRQYNTEATVETFNMNGDTNALAQKLAKITTATDNDNIKIIGCSSSSHTPDEVLPEKNIFTYLRNNDTIYDYVLVDCASLSLGPDSKELLKYVDAVILLYAADQTLGEEEKKFSEFLKRTKVNIIGSVLNKVISYNMDL